MPDIVDLILLGLLVVLAIAVVRVTDLFAAVMMFGIYSLLSAGVFVALDAIDVAFTEAAVGAGISTVLMLATLTLTTRDELNSRTRPQWVPLIVVILTGSILMYGTVDMPRFGDPNAPVQTHPIAERYISESPTEIGIPNMVTSVLASYRGYDTLGEVAVIFAAGVGVLLLLGIRRKPVSTKQRDD